MANLANLPPPFGPSWLFLVLLFLFALTLLTLSRHRGCP